MLVNTNKRDTATSILGHDFAAPIGICTTAVGINKIHNPQGEIAVTNVAEELGLPYYCLSTAGASGLEDVALADEQTAKANKVEAGVTRFFQLYMPYDDELTISLLK
ncbi:hypothetical protein FKW77_003446 [Venturia effusa]|uniref:FMN hydroxy acid dehydrogenase domain-containing protein n=1 Tax=Venturia effusa TaxID=50376 RepID=A0A517LL74_9PEZI|nr:hypothetical protein FKW77_003446 [Venturia effusa]